jgi:uncharacterized protein
VIAAGGEPLRSYLHLCDACSSIGHEFVSSEAVMKRMRLLALLTTTGLLFSATSCSLTGRHTDSSTFVDPALGQYVNQIWAVDNHAHPVLAPPLDATDREFDALPASSLEPQSDPVALRPDFPHLGAAWKALYGCDTPPPLDAEGLRRLKEARGQVKAREGEHYPDWVLDQAKIGTMLGNRVAMGRGVQAPRIRWVPYVDALLFPFDNTAMAGVSPDRKEFFSLEDHVRARYFHEAGMSGPPRTLDDYLTKVVTPTLERQKAGGAIAEKFEVAYLRSFDFSDPPRAQVANIYAKWVGHATPDANDYKLLQDFLFRYIAIECGRLGLAVHLHAMAGAGGYFSISGVNPLLLEPLFNDPRLRRTSFVLLHGGWPYVREIAALLQKPNVYADFSSQDLIIPPHTEAQWLREWLELQPEKVLFGTDGYPYNDELDWPEATWIAAGNAREALTVALSAMERDNEITPQRARHIAQMVLRGNAEALYRFTSKP